MQRFTTWAGEQREDRLSVLFTPWGEGLTRSWYRDAIVRLSHLPHVARVAIQTNLAARTGWLAGANPRAAALWATYHPGQVNREAFLGRCRELDDLAIRYSVGVVGLPEHYAEAVALRAALPPTVYLWVNAAEGHVYTGEEERRWTALDLNPTHDVGGKHGGDDVSGMSGNLCLGHRRARPKCCDLDWPA